MCSFVAMTSGQRCHLGVLGAVPPSPRNKKKRKKRKKKEKKRKKKGTIWITSNCYIGIKCCFFQFFNSPVTLKNLKNFGPPGKSWNDAPASGNLAMSTFARFLQNRTWSAGSGARIEGAGGAVAPFQDFQNDIFFFNFIGFIDSMFNMYRHIKL